MQSTTFTQNDNQFMLSGMPMGMLKHVFELNQQHLKDEVLALGSQVEETLALSMQTLQRQNAKQAMDLIVTNNSSLNQKCATIETDALSLLDTEWSTDRDLYLLASILEIALELEHIHGHATNIVEINLKMDQEFLFDSYSDFFELGEMTCDMLHQAMRAFADKDLDLVRFVPTQYSRVTDLYQQIHQMLLKTVQADQTMINHTFYLAQISQQLECVVDRTTNICEWVAFSITGEMRKLKLN